MEESSQSSTLFPQLPLGGLQLPNDQQQQQHDPNDDNQAQPQNDQKSQQQQQQQQQVDSLTRYVEHSPPPPPVETTMAIATAEDNVAIATLDEKHPIAAETTTTSPVIVRIDGNNNNNNKKRRVSASYGSRTTIMEIGLKRRSCICSNSKECNEIMTKWAKCNPSMYHYVQLPKLVGMDANGVHTTRNISDTELYKNQFRLATLRYLPVKNPIPKDERIALCHYREFSKTK
jgi:hypothetical protein